MGDAYEAMEATDPNRYGPERQLKEARAEIARLRDWLAKIDGGDNPCEDAALLRRWAYEANTLGRYVEDASSAAWA